MKKIFISHVSEDNQRIANMQEWIKDETLGINGIIDLCQNDHRDKGKDFIKKIIEKEIINSDVVVILVGRDSHSKPWIDLEIELAKKHKKKIIPLRLPNETAAKPKVLGKIEEFEFSKKAFKTAILK